MGKKLGLILITSLLLNFAFAAGDPAASVKALKDKLLSKGAPKIEGTYKLADKEIKNLKFGSMAVATNENAIVDGIKDKMGGVCTIFIKLANAEDYIRASTNVLDKDGKRAMGTLLKKPGPVYDAIKAGKEYKGEADIVGTMYNTVYEPIMVDGKVEGIYLCGFKKE